jgi:hypothetical protein
VSALESKIDDLYRGPLSEFVAARNALAKSLTGDEAKDVRALAKPTVVPWAVNQVYWHAREAYDRVMKSGEKLRKAQIAALEGRSADVRAATEAHRRAIVDAVGEAQRLSAPAGSAPSPDALTRTFEALSLASAAPESAGRLTQPLQPAGFEALAGVKPQPGALIAFQPRREQAPQKSAARRDKSEKQDKEDTRQTRAEEQRAAREREKAAAAAREHQAAVKQAEAKLARAEAAEQQARAVWDKAHDALLEARRALATVKSSG